MTCAFCDMAAAQALGFCEGCLLGESSMDKYADESNDILARRKKRRGR